MHLCTWLAEIGFFEVLKDAHEKGCPWDVHTTMAAAVNGHLSCLKYAIDNHCPYSSDILVSTAFAGHLDCVEYLHTTLNLYLTTQPTSFQPMTTSQQACFAYLRQHSHIQNHKCLVCIFMHPKVPILHIDWNDKVLWRVNEARKYLFARYKIYKAMERAYLDPDYLWCRRRLMRDFDTLCEITSHTLSKM